MTAPPPETTVEATTEATAPTPSVSFADFKAIGTALCNGHDYTYAPDVQPVYDAFLASDPAGLAALAALVKDTAAADLDAAIAARGLAPLANALAGSWYSGMAVTALPADAATYDGAVRWIAGTRPVVGTYQDAAVWPAVAYTGSSTICSGWGSWADAPQPG